MQHRIFILWCGVLLLSLSGAHATWRREIWQGAPGWSSQHDGWKAVVSEDHGRLVYFGPVSKNKNMLYSSASALVPLSDEGNPRSWGGHRAWLGPQTAWNPIWPPPVAWEFSGGSGRVQGDWLFLKLPAPDKQPQIERRYRWEKGRFRCDVLWKDTRRAWCAIQIFTIPAKARIEAPFKRTTDWPQGFSLLPIEGRWDIRRNFFLPVQGVTPQERTLRFSYGKTMQKIGLPPAPLRWSIGKDAVILERTSKDGRGSLPDEGALSQVYLGNPKLREAFSEVEQLSVIHPPSALTRRFTVYLRPENPLP